MTAKPLVILASARKQSDTRNFLKSVLNNKEYKLIDLLDFQISPYSYSINYPGEDEFLKVMAELLEHQVIVFATPVYWYAMSGLMKTFFDRFTDMVTTKKLLGRQLQGKSTFLLAVGADEELPNGFEVPFKLTSDYLGMTYVDSIYHSTKFPMTEERLDKIVQVFRDRLESIDC